MVRFHLLELELLKKIIENLDSFGRRPGGSSSLAKRLELINEWQFRNVLYIYCNVSINAFPSDKR